jgi:hypothetical protein
MSGRDPLSLGFFSVIVLGLLMVVFLCLSVMRGWRDNRPQFEGHWGGLGGGVGGWRISHSFIYLVLALAMGILGTSIAITLINRRPLAAVEKYQSVVRLMAELNVSSIQTYQDGSRVVIKGRAPDKATKDRIWDQIKLVNPALDDVTADITVPSPPKP